MPPIPAEGISAALAADVAGSASRALSPPAARAARRALLDGLGVMWAASGLAAEVAPFITLATAAATHGHSRVLGTGLCSTPALAALANGAMAHALDFEDALDGAPLHPNASLIPAVLALAEARPDTGITLGDLLAAIATGCEVSCRLALSLRQPLEVGGWYPPPILGAFGAVAGAAALLRLTPQQVVDAWSLLLMQNSCPGELKHSPGSVLRAVREAFPAQAAVQCALLAREGVAGFEQPLEGRHGFYALFAGGQHDATALQGRSDGQAWIERLSFKPWPCCRGTHPHIALVLQLAQQHGLDWRDIDRIGLGGGATQRMLAEPLARKQAPATAIDAKFSLPFCVATALVHGTVTLVHFSEASLHDARVLDMAGRTAFTPTAAGVPDNPTGGAVTLQLRDGRVVQAATDHAPGSPRQPLDDAALVAKFIDCTAQGQRSLPRERATAFAQDLLTLPAMTPAAALLQGLACA
ncbi:MAG: hypothetical protein RL026_861 [Pseudomonadota bacterium]